MVLNLVWPLLKSLPAMKEPFSFAYSTIPLWNVFYGDPFRYKIPSSIHAKQKRTDAGIGKFLPILDLSSSIF